MSEDSVVNEEELSPEALAQLRRNRVIFRIAVPVAAAVVLIVAAAAWLLMGGDESSVSATEEYEPAEEEITDDESAAPGVLTSPESGPTLVLGLDRQTGQLAGDLALPSLGDTSGDYLDRDHARALDAASESAATGGALVTPGECAYTDPCPRGLPRQFKDDLGIKWAGNEIGLLPRDDPEWHKVRIDCYLSSRLIEDCNFELAVGGYGELGAAGFDTVCLSEQFAARMASTLTPVAAQWWACESDTWLPKYAQAGLVGACEQTFAQTAPSVTDPSPVVTAPAADDDDGDAEGDDGDGSAETDEGDEEPPALPPSTPVTINTSSDDDIERCVAAAQGSDEETPADGHSPCEIARAVLAAQHPTAVASVPPCGIAALAPTDTWSRRTKQPVSGS